MSSLISPRGYNDAITALNSLQSNYVSIQRWRQSGAVMTSRSIDEMIEFMRRIGYKPSDLNKLNIVHVAGTKGKGSTCAFTASILSQYRTAHGPITKICMYTSPHLMSVRERIQINGSPISEALFAKYFFEVWDKLESSCKGPEDWPAYFRFLTLLAFYTCLCEKVDTAIFEVGIGGEYDSTNVVEAPTVVGITNLELEHTQLLGETIEEIAWHKAGIIKPGRPAMTLDQSPKALDVIRNRGLERGIEVKLVPTHGAIASGTVKLGLPAKCMLRNASLAVALATEHLKALDIDPGPTDHSMPEKFAKGLAEVVWPGRCQVIRNGGIEWFIDGAHTVESLADCGDWYASTAGRNPSDTKRVLIFNQQARDPKPLIKSLADSLYNLVPGLDEVIFCTNITFKDGHCKPELVSFNTSPEDVANLSVQKALAEAWADSAYGKTPVRIEPTIEQAVEVVEGLSNTTRLQVLVTGSFHLIGGLLEVLDQRRNPDPPTGN